ncbi:DUF4926 domain-containing protein [Mucilaginibacter sp. AW1-3]
MMSEFFSLIGVIFIVITIYEVVNVFLIKHKEISFYFRLYGLLLLLSLAVIYLSPFLLFRILPNAIIWQSYISAVMNMLPPLVLLVLYVDLHNKTSRFRLDDIVIIKKDIENVPEGTQGTITARHAATGYYEAEFFDDRGNLLNVLTVSAKDIEHGKTPDLQARIEAFGQ